MTMHVKVRVSSALKETPFVMTVTGAEHREDFTEHHVNHGDVWAAARVVSEAEQDYLVATGKGDWDDG